jgi:hypothetical protein
MFPSVSHGYVSPSRQLDMIQSFPPSESSIFPEYVVPALVPLQSDPEEFVREVLAECLPKVRLKR